MRRPDKISIIKAVLNRVAPMAEVILFGSEARGEAHSDSDFDLLILTPTKLTYHEERAITDPLIDLFWDQDIDVSPIVYSRSEWENRPFETDFYRNVMREGIRL